MVKREIAVGMDPEVRSVEFCGAVHHGTETEKTKSLENQVPSSRCEGKICVDWSSSVVVVQWRGCLQLVQPTPTRDPATGASRTHVRRGRKRGRGI